MSGTGDGVVDAPDEAVVAAWQRVGSGLRRDLGAQIYGQWIKPLELSGHDPATGDIFFELPSEFTANWIRERYADRLRLAFKAQLGHVGQLHFGLKRGASRIAAAPNGDAQGAIADTVTPDTALPLDPRMTFDRFIEGDSNGLALSAARKMAEAASPLFNPLYLQSATGQGKTHLMHAIGHAYRAARPSAHIVYMTAERFMIEYVASVRRNESMEFKFALRQADLFMVDDIQFIMGKASTQEEFLHTVDALAAMGKRVVVACDRAPQALDGIDQRLLSRLSMGLVADIQPASLELRRKILEERLAQLPQQDIGEDVVDFLARTISRNIRELEGGLNKLLAYAQLTGRPVTKELAESQLSDVLSACRRRITIDEIQRAVCDYYRVDRREMASKRRARAVARPRQVAMYLAKLMTPRSYPEIGRKFGGRDHSTVIHAVKLIEQLRAEDSEMDSDVRMLLRQLES